MNREAIEIAFLALVSLQLKSSIISEVDAVLFLAALTPEQQEIVSICADAAYEAIMARPIAASEVSDIVASAFD